MRGAHGARTSPTAIGGHISFSKKAGCDVRLTVITDGRDKAKPPWLLKSPRREVVRSSVGAGVVYPPFLGSFASGVDIIVTTLPRSG